MSSEQVEILQARLHQAQGVLGALQATDDGTGTVLDPHMCWR